jgi:DNA-binding response OmpR family regulator
MSDRRKVLAIDDDPSLLRLLEHSLERGGYIPLLAKSGLAGLRIFYQHKPDLVVLDITMPEMDGWTTCQRIREISDVPIIMLTAQASKEDIVKGLDLGADDCLVKPFEIAELLARICANLRRVAVDRPVTRDDVEYSDDFLTINLAERRITCEGSVVNLTKTEFDLLALLVRESWPGGIPWSGGGRICKAANRSAVPTVLQLSPNTGDPLSSLRPRIASR